MTKLNVRFSPVLTAVCCTALIAMPDASHCHAEDRNFGQDVEFLNKHLDTLVLRGADSDARVAVVPALQGRVMTSSAAGLEGVSCGWINYARLAEGIDPDAQINAVGGEERFWLGPEGGQFSLFFAPGESFDLTNWKTPALIDSEPFEVVEKSGSRVMLSKDTAIANYSQTEFRFTIDRSIEVVSRDEAGRSLGMPIGEVRFVGYRTVNRLTNAGQEDWTKGRGLLSIWLLGMFKPSPSTTVAIPYRAGADSELGVAVNDDYFGAVPTERLRADQGVIFFSGDGRYRSKIGVSPRRSLGVCGSYDSQRGMLTIVKYKMPSPATNDYVNSAWEMQDRPYAGDAINAYNDGPPEPGKAPLGPFYELETSSPALALKAGESAEHVQETYHLIASASELDPIAKKLLGATTGQIANGLK